MAVSAETRERIRRNVGYPHRAVLIHPPGAVAEAGLFVPTRVPLPPGVAPPPAAPPSLIFPGISYCLTAATPAATREIVVTPKLGFPFQLRQAVAMGTWDITAPVSMRILVSDDNDATAVADPTGDDVIDFRGDVIGAEDPGVHFDADTNQFAVEPWTHVGRPGKYIKVKVHNAAGVAVTWSVFLDLDILPT